MVLYNNNFFDDLLHYTRNMHEFDWDINKL